MPLDERDQELLTESNDFRAALNTRATVHIGDGADQAAGHLLVLERRIYVAMNQYALAQGLNAAEQEQVAAAPLLSPSPRPEKCRHDWLLKLGAQKETCTICGIEKSARGRKAKPAAESTATVPAAAVVGPVAP